ncbi:hypothetical protein LCGC14_2306970 [marine sediment metagenome]|uniref:Uncharacterized protein n=1 Tax=marine sediment metagenome TaxID=412755 RepID=A0A0F9D9B8_9ZZZZ
MDIGSIVGLVVGIVALLGVGWRTVRWCTRIETKVDTLWATYLADGQRPDLGAQHSDFRLNKEGHDLIPDDLKGRLDALTGNPGGLPSFWSRLSRLNRLWRRSMPKEEVASGYLVVHTLGLEDIRTWASEKNLSVQEAIAVLSAYLAERIDQGV